MESPTRIPIRSSFLTSESLPTFDCGVSKKASGSSKVQDLSAQNEIAKAFQNWKLEVEKKQAEMSEDAILKYIKSLRRTYPNPNEPQEIVVGQKHIVMAIGKILESSLPLERQINNTLRFSGILLFGVPGVGKSLILRECAKTTASDAGITVSMFQVRVSDLLSKFLGDSEKSIKHLFQYAEECKPSLILIDEVDSLMGKRQSEESEHSNRFKGELLSQMDGFNNRSGIVVVASTNRPDFLDTAFLRRFQLRFQVNLPSSVERNILFKKFLMICEESHVVKWEAIDLSKLSKLTEKLTGDDIKNIVRKVVNYNTSVAYQKGCSSCAETNTKIVMNTEEVNMEILLQHVSSTKPTYDHKDAKALKKWAFKHENKLEDDPTQEKQTSKNKSCFKRLGEYVFYCCFCGCLLHC